MRIVHLILSSRFAGSERHVVELVNAQAQAGHDVTLVLRRSATQDRPDAVAHRVDPRVAIVPVPDLFRAWHARRLVRRLKPDVAHAHLNRASQALHGLRGTCLRVATLHIEFKASRHGELDGLIAIAPWQMDAIPEPLRSHSVQIDNWTRSVAPVPDARDRIRHAHGIAPDAFVFGALGRVEHSKGLDVLLDAWRRAALPPQARLVIAGQGRAFDTLREAAPQDVVMPGFVTDTRDWMEAFDLFVSAARSEPFGLVMLEAMMARLPILASASEGAQHLAGAIGMPLLPIGDADALAAALRSAYETRPARRDYPMQRFDIAARVAEVEAFYRRELAATASRIGS